MIILLDLNYTLVANNPARGTSYTFEPDRGQPLKANQGRNENGVWTEVGGRCVYGYWSAA